MPGEPSVDAINNENQISELKNSGRDVRRLYGTTTSYFSCQVADAVREVILHSWKHDTMTDVEWGPVATSEA